MKALLAPFEVVFKALADRSRLRVINLLLGTEEACGCELGAVLGMAQYEVSRHMASLRRAGVVKARRQGRWVYYSLAGETEWLTDLWRVLGAALAADAGMVGDRRRLRKRLALREGGLCVVGRSSVAHPGQGIRRSAAALHGTRGLR